MAHQPKMNIQHLEVLRLDPDIYWDEVIFLKHKMSAIY